MPDEDVGKGADQDTRQPDDQKATGKSLSKINEYEYWGGRPLLPALVMLKQERFPSNGFGASAA